ncbi:MAG: hypothetical protein HYZ89_02835 [Candidatus Omnitrophica bacterium]|nr:hypothetical protein [Candidatus Omnitrophota bacterium]
MAKIFLLHWHEAEAKERASGLRSAGHDVLLHWSTESSPPLKDVLPDIAVISLDRLPSHGRAVAEWLWEAKKRQHIPIIFAGGEPSKVDATRVRFPKAVYCSTASMVGAVAKLTRPRSSSGGPVGPARSRAPGAHGLVRPNKALQPTSRARQPKAKLRKKPRAARG